MSSGKARSAGIRLAKAWRLVSAGMGLDQGRGGDGRNQTRRRPLSHAVQQDGHSGKSKENSKSDGT